MHACHVALTCVALQKLDMGTRLSRIDEVILFVLYVIVVGRSDHTKM